MSGFLWQFSHARRIKVPVVAEWNSSLAGVANQSYLYVTQIILGKDMLNQEDMTETAKAVFNELSDKPATAGEIAQNTHLSRERCQLILTQLVMAGLSDYQFGCYKRLQ